VRQRGIKLNEEEFFGGKVWKKGKIENRKKRMWKEITKGH
jgi:hypothetical protein